MLKTLLRFSVLLPLLLISSCKKESGPVEPPTTGSSGNISTGQPVEVARQSVPGSGGTISINNPGDPLDGFELVVPLNGFNQAQDFVVSHAEITSHQLGVNFIPISPLIKISYDGGYSSDLMTIKIPVKLPDGHFAMGFFYDEVSGRLEPIPVESLDSSSITLSTRHLSPSNATLGRGFLGKPQSVFGNLVISSVLATVLDGQPTLSSGFTPGVDDWEFVNYGSYIAPGGHCAGQSMSAMWYFYEKKLRGEPRLNHRFDTVNDPSRPDSLWSDNPPGYRFASTIQKDQDFENWIKSLNFQSSRPKLTWYCFIYAMLLTGEPQYVLIRNSATGAGHAMIIYKVTPSTGTLYIADPNYPGNREPHSGTLSTRIIEYENELLKPYSSALVSGGPGVSFDQIGYAAKTAYVDWSKISDRWSEFQNGTIGDDRFPDYKLWVRSGAGFELKDTLTTYADTLELHSRSTAAAGWIPDTDHLQEFWVYDRLGKYLGAGYDANKGIVRLLLSAEGSYKFGFYILGETASAKKAYVDFRWVAIERKRSEIDLSRVKQVGIAILSVATHWKDQDGNPFDKTFSPSWLADVTLSGNTLAGVSAFRDTVSATWSASSVSFVARNRTILGSLGWANTVITGTISTTPELSPDYFSYRASGPAACSVVSSLVLDTDGLNSTLESFSCLDNSLFGITFYY